MLCWLSADDILLTGTNHLTHIYAKNLDSVPPHSSECFSLCSMSSTNFAQVVGELGGRGKGPVNESDKHCPMFCSSTLR